jgi:hypothetical protein
VEFAESSPVDLEPLVGSLPDQEPHPLQESAFAEVQVNSDLPPLAILLGFALRLMVGAGAVTETVADWAAVPPEPVHVNV